MELSKDYVGKLVAIQFARPLMMFEYAAHVKESEQQEQLLGQPILRNGDTAVALDFVMGATIEAVGQNWVRFSMLDIRKDDAKTGNRIEHTVPSGLIMEIVEVVGFEVEAPSVIPKIRPESKILV